MLLRLKIYRLILKGAVYLLPLLAFEVGRHIWAASMLFVGRPVMYDLSGHLSDVLIGTFVWVFMAEHYKVTSVDELFRERTGARAAWSANLATAILLIGALYFGRNDVFPRGLFVSCIIAMLVLTLLLHAIFRSAYRQKLRLERPTRILIVGADTFAQSAASRLARLSFAHCQVVGYVRLPGQEVAVTDSHIYSLDSVRTLNPANGIDEVVMAIHPAQFSQIPRIMTAMEKLSIPARAIVDLGEGIVVRERLFQLGRMQMLDLTATPADLPDYVLLKRAFDIFFSAAALIITAPLMGLIALVIRLTSPGPIFFTQERIGLNGRPFRMYKFRTMKISPPSDSDARHTSQEDPRRTRIGILLRKTSLDELPQFVNVLKGNMSVVGPRPELTHFATKFLHEISQYNHRHCLRVGMTGWAQVNGWRGDTSIEKRIQYDLYYLQNWTFGLDLRIIALTILSVLVGRNAY
jgi:Undecaprenyl-phosphate glucose phosphotransferase